MGFYHLSFILMKLKGFHWTQNWQGFQEWQICRQDIDRFSYPTLQQQRERNFCIVLDISNITKQKEQKFQSPEQFCLFQHMRYSPFHKIFTTVSAILLKFPTGTVQAWISIWAEVWIIILGIFQCKGFATTSTPFFLFSFFSTDLVLES